jgi:hypothetical protein
MRLDRELAMAETQQPHGPAQDDNTAAVCARATGCAIGRSREAS